MPDNKHPTTEIDSLTSTIRLKLLDPLGNVIQGLKYQIRQGSKIVAQGVTDSQGKIQQFVSDFGKVLSVEVEHFTTGGMKEIRQLRPVTEDLSLKLVSGKVMQKTQLAQDKGNPGGYRRKTYVIEQGDTLSTIGKANGTTAQAIATLNDISLHSILQVGHVLKLPLATGGNSAPVPAPAPALAPATVPAPAPTVAPAPPSEDESPTSESTSTVTSPTTNPPAPTTAPPDQPATPKLSDDRGGNGTPKTIVALQCDQTSCIKLGDKGPLIEELNVRLMGFGNTISSPTPLNEFTASTENAVKQFQRDYMGVTETGKVCGGFLTALDGFLDKYPISLASMKCHCGRCQGFGNNQTDSRQAGVFIDTQHTQPRTGVEYPGIHRMLLWSFRAALFYAHDKDKALTFKFLRTSSGYRCWYDNAGYLNGVANQKTKRNSTNHMGNALDLQWTKGASTARCQGADVDELRDKIFVKRLGAQLGWPDVNMLSLERASDGATSWVHMDVRALQPTYRDTRFYAVTQAYADGDKMIEMARREGRLGMISCGGLTDTAQGAATVALPAPAASIPSEAPIATPGTPPSVPSGQPAASPAVGPAPANTEQRVPVSSLSLSSQGLDFIKGWENLSLTPYNDSEGYCTVGWGKLIAMEKCENLKGNPDFELYRAGISSAEADSMLKKDIKRSEQYVKNSIDVPVYQQEYDALVSLIFNIGSAAGFKKCPKLLLKLNSKDYNGCCDEFADITNKGTNGLVKRRRAEMRIFRNNVYDSSH